MMDERMQKIIQDDYPLLGEYTTPVKKAERKIVGRDEEIRNILAALMRPELCNVLLLAQPGSGKTATVQGTMIVDSDRYYLEVDLARMIANLPNPDEMAAKLKGLFSETASFVKKYHREIVLFIDEFHQIVQLSPVAVEALKPLLADSGTRGVRVIAATTYAEFRQYISPNQPLVERLQRFNLPEPDKDMTVQILRGMAERYGVANQFLDDSIFEQIYEYTQRYMPSNAQPRKSLLVLDAMVGWYRAEKRPMDMALLADVIYQAEGVNVAFRVDAGSIKKRLDERVLSQEFATSMIEQRLQICVADLNDKSKPMSSFLFCGSTGVGKGLRNDTPVPVWVPDGSVHVKNNGDLNIGDYVFNRKGQPVRVVGVFPQGLRDIYRVSFTDGREIFTDSSHLWTYMYMKGKGHGYTYTNSTKELLDRGVYIEAEDGRRALKYWIPMNEAVCYPEQAVTVHPYVMGAFIGDGCLTMSQLVLSSSDEDLVQRVAMLLGNCEAQHVSKRGYNWTFRLRRPDGRAKSHQSGIVFRDYPEVLCTAPFKHIPDAYKYGSIEQRWELVRGLFDTDGSIGKADGGRYNVSFSSTSLQLILDLQEVLYSLGVASTYTVAREADTGNGHYVQYRLSVKSSNAEKDRFFWLPRKRMIAEAAKQKVLTETGSRKKDYLWVGITNIEKMDYQAETTCIYVDDDEHLYQAGQYIVTHNTEVCKQLANILFESERSLIRIDCTEFANPESLDRFRRELTNQVWARPYSIVLLDEIEKACPEVTRLLLQVLDDGRLVDENNRVVGFTNAYVIMTTNAGAEIFKTIAQYNVDDSGSGKGVMQYEKVIRDSIVKTTGGKFPPELLGRIDVVVPFQPLSEATMEKIVVANIQKLAATVLAKHGVVLKTHRDVVRYLVGDTMDTDSDAGGARAVKSKLESEVTVAVAAYINSHPNDKKISVSVVGEMARDNKYKRVSDARIVVKKSIEKE